MGQAGGEVLWLSDGDVRAAGAGGAGGTSTVLGGR